MFGGDEEEEEECLNLKWAGYMEGGGGGGGVEEVYFSVYEGL